MKTFTPNYYNKFKCIADRCKHSCCIGWEIDIDEITLESYRNIDGAFGERLRSNIDFDCDCPHFILKQGDKCPFLNEKNLCDMICELGEDSLCDICADHPRFRNFFSDSVEEGIGLCCEEAARIILCEKDRFALISDDCACSYTDEEIKVLGERQEIFDLLQNREFSVSERLKALSKKYSFDMRDFQDRHICDLFLSLERLDDKWTELVYDIFEFETVSDVINSKELSSAFENLSCYLVFRHFYDSVFDGRKQGRVKLVVAGCILIALLCCSHAKRNGTVDFSDMIEICRMFSSEIEYSEENLDTLFNNL